MATTATRRRSTTTTQSLLQQRPSFWEDIHKIRTNGFEYNDKVDPWDVTTTNNSLSKQPPSRKWTFRSRKSHILDTNGYYKWNRELNCFQGQDLPEAVFPRNTLEILLCWNNGDCDCDGDGNNNNKDNNESDVEKKSLRIRFGALEGLRGWMSLDSKPIPVTYALDNAHWKAVAETEQLPNNGRALLGGNNNNESILSSSYDYAYTTPYKGGTDTIDDNGDDDENYEYLTANSTSFVSKHDLATNDRTSKSKTAAGRSGIQQVKKLRRPICKCKSDGGRAPLVSSSSRSSPSKHQNNNGDSKTPIGSSMEAADSLSDPQRTTNEGRNRQQHSPSPKPLPEWKPLPKDSSYKVDIEGMLRRAAAQPFLFREDVDLWSDDLHDNGDSWLKARCFVCSEGWACLLRNFVRVDGVLCRVIDTRYIHTFGTNTIYREHSWREGPWEYLIRAIQRGNGQVLSSRQHKAAATATTTAATRRPPPQQQMRHPGPSTWSNESINDSIAARYLPLAKPPITECLSLEEPKQNVPKNVGEKQQQQLVMINNATIDDAIPVPNPRVETALGISFVLKRSKGNVLEALSSSVPVSSLWSRSYTTSGSNGDSTATTPPSAAATILTVGISPDPNDGGRLAIGDDRGWVAVWRLTNGESLWRFPVAPKVIRNRLEKNPFFESEKLWVDHLVWSADGCLVGAAAGRTTVLASTSISESSPNDGKVQSTLESTSGTVTGLAFRTSSALAVASYGEVNWLTPPPTTDVPNETEDNGGGNDHSNGSKQPLQMKSLKRDGAAVECIDISPDGKRIVVGFLDKTLRVYTMQNPRGIPTTTTSPANGSSDTTSKDEATLDTADNYESVVDWAGFNASVKSVRFSPTGRWLAAMGGSSLLVLSDTLDVRREAPIVCRTPGRTQADGGDGTCHKFAAIEWSATGEAGVEWLAALDSKTGSVHVFRFERKHRTATNANDAWPICALPVRTVSPPFRNPSPPSANGTRFSFFVFSNIKAASMYNIDSNDDEKKIDESEIEENSSEKEIGFLLLDSSGSASDGDRRLHQEFGTKLRVGNDAKDREFSFRTVQ